MEICGNTRSVPLSSPFEAVKKIKANRLGPSHILKPKKAATLMFGAEGVARVLSHRMDEPHLLEEIKKVGWGNCV